MDLEAKYICALFWYLSKDENHSNHTLLLEYVVSKLVQPYLKKTEACAYVLNKKATWDKWVLWCRQQSWKSNIACSRFLTYTWFGSYTVSLWIVYRKFTGINILRVCGKNLRHLKDNNIILKEKNVWKLYNILKRRFWKMYEKFKKKLLLFTNVTQLKCNNYLWLIKENKYFLFSFP